VSEPETTVTDGFGRRLIGTDAETGDQVELLEFTPELVEHSGFVTSLAERVARLASVRHASYARVRRLDRPDEDRLQLVSDFTAGWRLFEMLDQSEAGQVKLDITVVIGLVRQLLPAVALFSRNNRDNAIGTLSPQRLIVMPQGRLVIAECVFGPAIEKLNLDRDTLWRDFRIAMPPSTDRPRANPRADAYAVGVVALSLLLGRVLDSEEFPGDLEELVENAQEYRGGDASPLSATFATWLQRALQLDAERAFQTPSEMQLEFEKVLASDRSYVTTGTALSEWVFRVGTKIDNGRRPAPAREPALSEPSEPERVPEPEPEPEPVLPAHADSSAMASAEAEAASAPEGEPEPGPEAEPEPAPRESWMPQQPAMYREPAFLVNREPDPTPEPPPPTQVFARAPEPPTVYSRESVPEPEPVASYTPEPEPPAGKDSGQLRREPVEPVRPIYQEPEPVRYEPPAPQPEPIAEEPPVAAYGQSSAYGQPSAYGQAPYSPYGQPPAYEHTSYGESPGDAQPSASGPSPEYDASSAVAPAALVAPVAPVAPSAPESPEAVQAPEAPEVPQSPYGIEGLRSSRSPLIYGLAAAVVLLIVVVGWLATRGGGGIGAGEGQLVVTSRPEGAQVTIDGEVRGQTPLTVSLNAGAHVMEVQSGKSEPRVIPLTITAGVQTAQYVELQGVVATGSLEIASDPPGARITIDGQSRGTTPMTVSNLSAGDHTVVLELRSKKSTQVVRIQAGSAAKLSVPIR
jgi:hypothetical protein